MSKLPREDSSLYKNDIENIINNPDLSTEEKTCEVYRFDYDLARRETDRGRVQPTMSKSDITRILKERGL